MIPVVISRLSCGLGNQLFQYAAALGVSNAVGAVPLLDRSGFDDGTEERGFALDRYDLGIPVLTGGVFDADFASVGFPPQAGLAEAGIDESLEVRVRREDNYAFEPDLMSEVPPLCIRGFWQSWKYLDAVTPNLRARLGVPPSPSGRNAAALAAIAERPVVSVHVRRGDYATPYNQTIFGLCEPAYYEAAMELLRERLGRPKFLVFSDDPEWCRSVFLDPDTTVVSEPDSDACDDLALMSRCRHHIIANSSFGWWAAWLGRRRDSLIVAPVPWYTQAAHTSDLIPDDWIRLDRRTGEDWRSERQRLCAGPVSVVVLARNGGDVLARALDSVAAQDYPEIEVIVAVPGDVREGRPMPDDLPVDRVDGANCAEALRRAVDSARGEWIAFLDDGDVWRPGKLRIQVETAQLADARVVLCRTQPVAGPAGMPAIFPPPGPPNRSLKRMIEGGAYLAGISHVLARREAARALRPLEPDWRPERYSPGWQELVWQPGAVQTWERLVESPIPYMAGRGEGW